MPADERRQSLLDVSVRVFAQRGYERTSVAHICKAAGIGRGTFYEYFGSKHDLFRELLGEHARRLLERMEPFYRKGVLPLAGGSVQDLVAARFHEIFAHFREHRDIYNIFLREALAKNAATGDLFRLIQNQQIAVVADELRQAMAIGVIRKFPDATQLATFLLGGVMHVAFKYLIDESAEVDLDALAADVAAMALAALAPAR